MRGYRRCFMMAVLAILMLGYTTHLYAQLSTQAEIALGAMYTPSLRPNVRFPLLSTDPTCTSVSDGVFWYNTTSDIMKYCANGSASSGGTISGTGTTNLVAKWTSSTALGNSLLSDSGTNLTLTSGQLLLPDGTAAAPSLSFTSATGHGLYYYNSTNLGLSVGGTLRMLFTTAPRIILPSTGQLTFTSAAADGTVDTILARDAAGVLAQRNVANAQTSRIYGTFTDASNYERLSLSHVTATGSLIAAETAGSGGDNLGITLTPAGTGNFTLTSGQILVADGSVSAPTHSFTSATNTGFFRNSGGRINIAIAGSIGPSLASGGPILGTGMAVIWTSNATPDSGTTDTFLYRDAANVLAQRNTANAQTLRVYGTADAFPTLTNYERLSLSHVTGTGSVIAAETLGTGGDNLGITLTPAGTGNLALTSGQLLLPNGSSTAPSLAFNLDTGQGIFWSSASNYMGIVMGGSWRWTFDSFGPLMISLAQLRWSADNPLVDASAADLIVLRDAADILALRRTTTAQTLRVYGTADAAGTFTNYVRASLGSSSTVVTLAAETAGTGADNVSINLDPAGTGTIQVDGTDGITQTCIAAVTGLVITKGIITGVTCP